MRKIVYYVDSDLTIGCYDFLRDTVILDSKLRDYPNLRRYVLDHEFYHRGYGKNLWKHFVLDLKNFYFLHTKKGKIVDELKDYEKVKKKEIREMGIFWIINLQIMNLFLQVGYCFVLLFVSFKKLFSKLIV